MITWIHNEKDLTSREKVLLNKKRKKQENGILPVSMHNIAKRCHISLINSIVDDNTIKFYTIETGEYRFADTGEPVDFDQWEYENELISKWWGHKINSKTWNKHGYSSRAPIEDEIEFPAPGERIVERNGTSKVKQSRRVIADTTIMIKEVPINYASYKPDCDTFCPITGKDVDTCTECISKLREASEEEISLIRSVNKTHRITYNISSRWVTSKGDCI